MKKRRFLSFAGYAILFVTIAVIITVAIAVFDAVSQKYGENKAILSVVMLITIAFLALVCTVIDAVRRKITVNRPVEQILEATQRIASGDFSVRLQISHSYRRYDEYDLIAENINRMARELSRTEVVHNDFISNVSHELKTPVSILRSYAMALQNENLDPAVRNHYAQVLVSASDRLSALVTNILKLNKLENQELAPQYENIRLDEMLAQSLLQFEEKIDEKGLELDCELKEVYVSSDADFLEIIWSNLISNAIKFTELGGKIRVTLYSENGQAVVKVSDTGCGISRDTGKHIFDKFYQGETSHAKEGNGLGLSLVKKVIDILGGEISVESEVGKGSTFTVILKGAAA